MFGEDKVAPDFGRSGDATVVVLLLLWLSLLANVPAAPVIAGAQRVAEEHAGAVLFNELGCANCHGGAAGSGPARSGPELRDLAQRVEYDWVLGFLAKPEHDRMPAMFATLPEAERGQAIGDVAAWLGTLQGEKKLNLKAQRHANAERGSALYHEVGCVACHAPTAEFKPERPALPIAVPLPDLERKTSLSALAHFLSNTNELRPDARMPQVPLDTQEAIDIAAHLLDFQSSDPREAKPIKPWPKPAPGSVKRGRRLVESLNCAACHSLPGIEAQPLRKIRGLDGPCLDGRGAVRYQLSESQRVALIGYLPRARLEGLDLLIDQAGFPQDRVSLGGLNCYACHERAGIGGPTPETDAFFLGDLALGDAGRIPPPLTLVGRKLNQAWLLRAARGDPETRVRPYLKTRMPTYPRLFGTMMHFDFMNSGDLVREDVGGVWEPGELEEPPKEIAKVDALEAGRKLLGTHGGVNCITCHAWGERPSLGIRGMDISVLDQRLKPGWFRAYLLDPASYRAGTLMPALWPQGKSTVKDVLGGDTEQQIGAIWAFIRDGKGLPDGFPDRAAGNFELVPKDRPIIQRTFLEGVGTHAILVGFPGGINLAYDAATAGPSLVWRGRFFDAYGTWFSRFAPFEKPLEDKTYAFPDGAAARYLGYELDAVGNPTFLSRVGEQERREHFEVKDGKLVRRLSSEQNVGHPKGMEVEREKGALTITYSWK